MKKYTRPVLIVTSAVAHGAGAVLADCYTTTGYFAPDIKNSQKVDETNMGVLSCDCDLF